MKGNHEIFTSTVSIAMIHNLVKAKQQVFRPNANPITTLERCKYEMKFEDIIYVSKIFNLFDRHHEMIIGVSIEFIFITCNFLNFQDVY